MKPEIEKGLTIIFLPFAEFTKRIIRNLVFIGIMFGIVLYAITLSFAFRFLFPLR